MFIDKERSYRAECHFVKEAFEALFKAKANVEGIDILTDSEARQHEPS